jgi:Ca2+-binding RTX toxin-like protein
MSHHGKKFSAGARRLRRKRRLATVTVAALVGAVLTPLTITPAQAVTAPAGQGFVITPSDLKFILAQTKIAEHHAYTLTPDHLCDTMIGTGPNQFPSALVSKGLRTVDGSCNNLIPGQEGFGAADELFPRISSKSFRGAEGVESGFFGPGSPAVPSSSYVQTSGNVFDSTPRTISNLIVDQTRTNPAAIAAAGFPVRSQDGTQIPNCTTDPDPLATPPVEGVPEGCLPSKGTLFIPNVTTDVGLSPPYNSLFTLFGQFFDHGVDQTVKDGGTVYVPLKDDDPLITVGPDGVANTGDEVGPSQRFMVLTRGKNQPGEDGVLGTEDDIRDATNTDSPWVDQSQTYTSHSSHQVFLREYENNAVTGKPESTGMLLGGPAGPTAGGMATWATVKAQADSLLGLHLVDKDVLNVPMIASDPYGNFEPGPLRGLPQYVTASGLVEGDTANPVPVPADVKYFDTPFVTDIAHNADPSPQDVDHDPGTPKTNPTPDVDTEASADFANQPPGTYDDEMLNAHFAAGDGRVNENIGLTAIHQVFHSEHDRLIGVMETTLHDPANAALLADYQNTTAATPGDPHAAHTFTYGERLFQAARFVTEMEYQHLVFEEFARKVQPAINPFQPFAFTQTELNPAIKAEFAHAVYRFGHSMLTETISRRNEDKPGADGLYGTKDDIRGSQNDISLLDGFLNPPAYTDGGTEGELTSEQAAGSIVMGMADQTGNELDEFVTDTLRNNLLGLPLDLPTINMTRARSEGIPPLNVFRREVFNKTNDGSMRPYTNWIDFGEALKHPESLTNFVAAYGQHPSITGATTLAGKREAARLIVNPNTVNGDVPPADAAAFMNSIGDWANAGTSSKTGLDGIDLWVGGLAEQTNVFGGLLGPTFNYVFESQLTDLQNGDRLYYLARTPGMNLRSQLEGNSFGEMIMRNTNAHTLKADVFATADCKFELKNLDGTPEGFNTFGNTVANDVDSECSEPDLLIRMPDGTIKYRARNTVDPSGINGQSVYNGTAGVDRVFGGNDSDTFWGGQGNDIIEGGDGADVTLGGEGNDIITDLNGDDVPKGGPGNDAIDSGPGLDIIMGGEGNDFSNGGLNTNETFAGEGDDFAIAGAGEDAVFGDGGDDWEEGGDSPDLLIGDSSNLFFLDDSQKPGHDILIGQGGDDDYDFEGGDDIGVAGPGIEKIAGGSGYDWEIGLEDPQAQNADLDLPILVADILDVAVRDRYNEVEALSGGKLNDTLRGDDRVPTVVGGAGFTGCNALDQAGLDRIAGLDALVPPLNTPLQTVIDASVSKDCPVLQDAVQPAPGQTMAEALAAARVWGDGNILLAGGGSDLIEGRGADDIIDGDRYVNVRLSVRTNRNDPATEIGSAAVNSTLQSAMRNQYLKDGTGALTGPTLQEAVFAGTLDPGNIIPVREILSSAGATDVDTALFSGARDEYTIARNGDTVTVTHDGGGVDGVDTIRNVEKLQFTDQTVEVAVSTPAAPTIGTATAGNTSATVRWTAPTNTGGLPLTGFQVQVLDGVNVVDTVTDIAPTATSTVVEGLTNGTAYTFKVVAVNEVGPGAASAASNAVTPSSPNPSAGSFSPAAAATGVAVGTDVTATFDRDVTNVSGQSFRLRNTVTNTLVGAVVTYNATTRVATLNPNANLAPGTSYTAQLIGTGINGIRSGTARLTNTSWTFTTAADTTAPTASAAGPTANQTGVALGTNVLVAFSERVVGVNGTTVRLRIGQSPTAGTVVGAAVTLNAAGTRATLNPNNNLARNTFYTVVVTAPIRDTSGNQIATTSWTFRTRP